MNQMQTEKVTAAEMSLEAYVSYCLKGLDAIQLETFSKVSETGHGKLGVGSDRETVRVAA